MQSLLNWLMLLGALLLLGLVGEQDYQARCEAPAYRGVGYDAR